MTTTDRAIVAAELRHIADELHNAVRALDAAMVNQICESRALGPAITFRFHAKRQEG